METIWILLFLVICFGLGYYTAFQIESKNIARFVDQHCYCYSDNKVNHAPKYGDILNISMGDFNWS